MGDKDGGQKHRDKIVGSQRGKSHRKKLSLEDREGMRSRPKTCFLQGTKWRNYNLTSLQGIMDGSMVSEMLYKGQTMRPIPYPGSIDDTSHFTWEQCILEPSWVQFCVLCGGGNLTKATSRSSKYLIF